MAYTNIIPDPSTVNDATAQFTVGGLYESQDATYGQRVVRYVQHKNAITTAVGMVALAIDAAFQTVTNDVTGGAATPIGTAADAAVPQIAVGLYMKASVTNGNYCFVLVKGRGIGYTDDGVSAGNRLIPKNVDGVLDTMTDGAEEQVVGIALADDEDVGHTVVGSWNFPL